MRIDLRDGRWSREYVTADSIEKISDEIRPFYVDLIVKLSNDRKDDIDWWVTSLAVRNTYICPLYFRLCQLILVLRVAKTVASLEVVVDSKALATIINQVAGDAVKVRVLDAKSRFSYIHGFLYRYSGALYHVIFQYVFSRLLLRKQKLPEESVLLVDIFFSDSSVKEKNLIDRYYCGMREKLSQSENARLLYTPTHYRVRNYFSYYLRLRNNVDQLLLKESILPFSDFLYALMHPFRLRWPDKTVEFMGLDVGSLVRESFLETFANSSSVEGLLRYCFAKRLKELGFLPQKIIEWYENQEVDHGAIAGWRKFFPDMEVVGYQGFFASKHYLAMYPTKQEHEFSLLPTKIAVIGRGLINFPKEFFSELEVVNAPAFRFSSVWDEKIRSSDEDRFTVLVSLPIHYKDSHNIVEMVKNVITRMDYGGQWRFLIKPHPTWKSSDIERLSIQDIEHTELVGGDFNKLLDDSDLIVGAATSACVQAIACGVPAIVVGRPVRLLESSIPAGTDRKLWAACYTSDELLDSLEYFLNRSLDEKRLVEHAAKKFREDHFNPVTSVTVREFIGL